MVFSNVGDAFPVLVFYRNPLADFFRQLLLHFNVAAQVLAVEGMMCPVFLDKPRNESRCDIVPYCDILYLDTRFVVFQDIVVPRFDFLRSLGVFQGFTP